MRRANPLAVAALLFLAFPAPAARADGLDQLASDFWSWRASHQPLSTDDIPRIERPPDWTPDWSAAAVAERRKALAAFEQRFKTLSVANEPVSRQVDYRLIGSAIARVRWELEVMRGHERNPLFYVDQTLGAVFDRLLQPPPFDPARSRELVQRMRAIPRVLEEGKANLHGAAAPFARVAIAQLNDPRPRLNRVVQDLKPYLAPAIAADLAAATEPAVVALGSFRAWLEQRLPTMSPATAAGRDAYQFFLKQVALMPFTPEQLLAMGRQEWERAVAFEAYEGRRNAWLPPLTLFPDQAAQMAAEKTAEESVRQFLEERGILSVPSWVGRYRNLPLPSYLEPLSFLGVTDDLTSPTRLEENGVSYIRPPAPTLGYFALSIARDPRTLIVHEGVPGHYLQLVLSWAHENPIRRHYYDSGANEGIGFYAEEMMMQAGLFDDRPRTREIIYNFMRLRALRVEVDVKLALGRFTIDEGADYLRTMVPMDAETARQEAVFFASLPGQAISYQIGKLQILRFLADARLKDGDRFSLRAFHDSLWKNGNVPIALQRWEALGLRDEIDALDRER